MIMATSLLLGACNPATDVNVKETGDKNLIGKSDIRIKDGRMTPEALWAMGRIGGMNVSPDGKKVVYTVAYYSVPENKSNREVFVMNADGSDNKQITKTGFAENEAVWIKGGTKIAFLCNESGSSQLWEMNPDGTGRKQLSNYDGDIEGFAFSPDEKNRLSVFASAANTDRDSYYGPGNDPLKAYGKTTDLTAMGGAQYVHTFDKCFFMPSDLTAGLEYNRDRLKDNMWGYNRHTDQTVNIYSAFLQNEWKNDRWGILIGGRLDKHNMVDNVIFSPRANLRFNPTQNINLRLSYSSGFRAPQAFDEDMHIENVGGTVAMIERAKDLKEEKSQSFSVSADMYHRFGAFQTNLLIEGFYTRLTDVFVLGKPYDRGDGILVKTRSNGPGAKVMGLTLEGKVAYLSILQIQAGLTLQRSRYDEPHKWHDDAPAEKKIFRTPDTYGYFTATCTPIKPLSIALSGTYTGRMLVQRMDITAENAELGKMPERKAEAIRTPRFFDLGVKLAYDFKLYKTVDLQLNGGVQNIFESYQKDFDRGANRDSGYIYGPSLPRSFFAGVKISY